MKEKDISLTTASTLELFAHVWEPETAPKAVITLVHGFGEHCLRYAPYFKPFIDQGFAVLGFDLQGHGQTKGKRGVINSYEGLLDDIHSAIDLSGSTYPSTPQFIYGHSMGGNLALNYLLRRKPNIAGGIITSPWLSLTEEPNFVLKSLVSLLEKITPNVTVNSNLDSKYISTIPKEDEMYKADPFNHGKISLKLLNNIVKSGLWAMKHTPNLEVPILLMHGTADRITSPISSKTAAENNPDKIEFITWEGAYHELHNDFCRNDVASTVIGWLNKSLEK